MSEVIIIRESKQWYHNPKTGKYRQFFCDEVPSGWISGNGKHWYTNLEKNFSCFLSDELVPTGYVPGMLRHKVKTKVAKKLDSRIVR